VRTRQQAPGAEASTFTQLKRRDQLVECTIDAIAELGFPRASVAEVARRAGVSKGVVTYHFAAKDDLIRYEVAHRRINRPPEVMSRLLLAMERRGWLRRRALDALATEPRLFERLLAVHAGTFSPRTFGFGNIFRLGWRLLATSS